MSWTSLGLELETAALPSALDERLRFRWQTSAPGPGVLSVTCEPGPLPPRPQVTPQEITVSNERVMVWSAPGELWLGEGLHLKVGSGGAAARLTVSPAAVSEGGISEGAVSEGAVSEGAVLLGLVELQRLAGWLPLHAATVMGQGVMGEGVTGQGRAVSITGVSGAGKSTAALRLAGAGYAVLAEDQTWVHPESMCVTGLDRFLRTYPDSLDRFAPHLKAQVRGVDSHGKVLLALTPPARAQLTALLVFGLPSVPSTAQKVRAVWECSGVPLLPRTRQVSAQAIGTLLRRLSIEGTTREEVLGQVGQKLTALSEQTPPSESQSAD